MAVSIFEALQNAKYNLTENGGIAKVIGIEQLVNAVTLLEKGYTLDDEVEPLLNEYGDVNNVPEKEVAG